MRSNPATNNQTTRDSNIELARIVAMLMILALHAFNPYFWNNLSDNTNPQNIIVIVGESITACAVGLFVFISGWYGIKPKVRSVANILFQVVFYGFLIFLVAFLISRTPSSKGFKDIFLFTDAFWFIKSYLLLYILSPVLNSFVEKTNKEQFKSLLLAMFCFQSIWGWANKAEEFHYGLSVVFLIFMYLLARYMRLYPSKFAGISKVASLGLFGGCVAIIAAAIYIIAPFLKW